MTKPRTVRATTTRRAFFEEEFMRFLAYWAHRLASRRQVSRVLWESRCGPDSFLVGGLDFCGLRALIYWIGSQVGAQQCCARTRLSLGCVRATIVGVLMAV